MKSANGYLLTVDGYTLHATWAAPYYSLHRSFGPDDDEHGRPIADEPLLIHCETLADAIARGGVILNADFEPIQEAR